MLKGQIWPLTGLKHNMHMCLLALHENVSREKILLPLSFFFVQPWTVMQQNKTRERPMVVQQETMEVHLETSTTSLRRLWVATAGGNGGPRWSCSRWPGSVDTRFSSASLRPTPRIIGASSRDVIIQQLLESSTLHFWAWLFHRVRAEHTLAMKPKQIDFTFQTTGQLVCSSKPQSLTPATNLP